MTYWHGKPPTHHKTLKSPSPKCMSKAGLLRQKSRWCVLLACVPVCTNGIVKWTKFHYFWVQKSLFLTPCLFSQDTVYKSYSPICSLILAGGADALDGIRNLENEMEGKLTIDRLRCLAGLVGDDLQSALNLCLWNAWNLIFFSNVSRICDRFFSITRNDGFLRKLCAAHSPCCLSCVVQTRHYNWSNKNVNVSGDFATGDGYWCTQNTRKIKSIPVEVCLSFFGCIWVWSECFFLNGWDYFAFPDCDHFQSRDELGNCQTVL